MGGRLFGAAGGQAGVADGGQTVRPSCREMVFLVGDKIVHRAVRMRFLPLRIQLVDIHAAGAPAKDAEERMMDRMPGDAAQRGAFETTFCIGEV